MREVYLIHPDHGIKVAYSKGEIAHDEKHGWVPFDIMKGPILEDTVMVEVTKKPRRATTVKEQDGIEADGNDYSK